MRLTEAGTQKDNRTRLMVESGQAQRLGDSEVRLLKLVCDAEGNMSTEADDFTLTRKTAMEHHGACTANRHR